MDPSQQPPAPQPYNSPGNYGSLMSQPPASGQMPAPSRKSRLPIIIGVVAGVLVVITIVVAVIVSRGKKPAPKPAATTTQTPQSQGPQPATAIGIEQTGNSISQDLSGLNDDKDIPATMLDDRPLGL